MKLIPALSLLLVGAALAAGAHPASSATAPQLHDVSVTAPVFLRTTAVLRVVSPAVLTPVTLGIFGTSVMPPGPNTGAMCSADAIGPGICSAQAPNARCSAFNDNDNFCSVSMGPIGTMNRFCSALDDNAACTVLPPSSGGLESWCSVRNLTNFGARANCSAFANAVRPLCSTKGQGASKCSAWEADAESHCSALNTASPDRALCTTKINIPVIAKNCSAFQVSAECSVLSGGNGRCTAFGAALQGSCSSFGGHCSVINGPAGNNCNQ